MAQKVARKSHLQDSSLSKAFLAGALSGTCSTILFQPFDLVKTRLQMEGLTRLPSGRVHLGGSGMLCTFYSVVQREHVVGLWRGLVPSLSRCVPGAGMYFCILHGMRSLMRKEPRAIELVLLGAGARTVTGITLLPLTVVKARYESGVFKYTSIRHALTSIWRSEGGKGLYSGLLATVVRDAPFSGLYLMFYSQIKKHAKNALGTPELNFVEMFVYGIMAGILASVATQPADVVKTTRQLYPLKYSSNGNAVLSILKTSGLSGFFKGLVPRTLRRTMMAALSWTVYETLSRELGLKT